MCARSTIARNTTRLRWPLLLAAAALALGARVRAAELVPETIAAGGILRHYILVQPSAPRRGGPAVRPLVLVLHGHGGSARRALGEGLGRSPLSVWRRVAERDGVLVVALDGVQGADDRQGWDDCRADAPDNPHTDDVAFARAIVLRMIRREHADPRRVYAMGMSNGGMMVLRLARELKPPLAAFAAVSASMAAHSVCRGTPSPISALFIDGTADPLMPYAGGEVGLGRYGNRGAVLGVPATVAYWLKVDGLAQHAPLVQAIPHRGVPGDTTRATREVWRDPVHGLAVELVRIDGGGHAEPSVTQGYRRLWLHLVGPQNRDFEAVKEAWSFFRTQRSGLSKRDARCGAQGSHLVGQAPGRWRRRARH